MRKVIRYEQRVKACANGSGGLDNVVAGAGGFGAVGRCAHRSGGPASHSADRAAGIRRAVTRRPTLTVPNCPPAGEVRSCVRQQLSEGSLAWIYLGHGLPTELDRVHRPTGTKSILSVADVPNFAAARNARWPCWWPATPGRSTRRATALPRSSHWPKRGRSP